MKEETYTRLDLAQDLKSSISRREETESIGSWFSKVFWDAHYDFDDRELIDAIGYLSAMSGGEEFSCSYEELDQIAENFFEVDFLYPKLVEYRKDFDDWENINKFAEDAEIVFMKEGVKAFLLLFSYLSYFNDKDYSHIVTVNLKATRSLEPDFCVKEFITNIKLLIPHAEVWAVEIIYAILKAPEYDACLDKYWYLADKDIFLGLLEMMGEGYYGEKHASRIQDLRNKLKNER